MIVLTLDQQIQALDLENDPKYRHICAVMQHPNGHPFRFTEPLPLYNDDGSFDCTIQPTECLTMSDEWRGCIADNLLFDIVELFDKPETVTITFKLASNGEQSDHQHKGR